jgi:hypothetical protein
MAHKLACYWTKKTRDNKTMFWTLTDDRPQWLYDAVCEAHAGGHDFPEDWAYEECRAACDAIDDGSLLEGDDTDALHAHADSRVDVYTKDLFAWAKDHCTSTLYANAEAEVEDLGGCGEKSVLERIALLQFFAIQSIARTILDAYKREGGPFGRPEPWEPIDVPSTHLRAGQDP